jgi:hypothetical protein
MKQNSKPMITGVKARIASKQAFPDIFTAPPSPAVVAMCRCHAFGRVIPRAGHTAAAETGA